MAHVKYFFRNFIGQTSKYEKRVKYLSILHKNIQGNWFLYLFGTTERINYSSNNFQLLLKKTFILINIRINAKFQSQFFVLFSIHTDQH